MMYFSEDVSCTFKPFDSTKSLIWKLGKSRNWRVKKNIHPHYPSKIEWDLTNGPLRKLLGVIRYPGLGVRSVGPVGDFLDTSHGNFSGFEP